jgi:hypothetical protein
MYIAFKQEILNHLKPPIAGANGVRDAYPCAGLSFDIGNPSFSSVGAAPADLCNAPAALNNAAPLVSGSAFGAVSAPMLIGVQTRVPSPEACEPASISTDQKASYHEAWVLKLPQSAA